MGRTEKRFVQIQEQANGMLAPLVYQRINEYAGSVPGSVMVEVGTAHGAATIAMALAAGTTGKRVVTFERARGGSREKFGSVADNVAIIRENFRRFGVEEDVDLRVGEVENEAGFLQTAERIGLLMIDADGCIDRDIALFAPNMEVGAIVVIDDYEDRARIVPRSFRWFRIDLKHRLTYRLVQHFKRSGTLEEIEVVNNTFFGRWHGDPGRALDTDQRDIVRIYRTLVHTDGRIEYPWVMKVKKAIRKLLQRVRRS